MRLLKPWTSQPQFPAAINPTYLAYRPRFILTPSVFFDYLGGVQPSLANDANRRPGSYNFPGVNGYIDTGSTSRVTHDAHSILVVSKLSSFVSSYPVVASYKTSSSRMQLFYSNDAPGGYTDLCWGPDGAGAVKSRLSLSAFGSVTGTRHQLVLTRGPGVVQKAWCNGQSLTSATPGSFGSNSGNSVLGQASTSALSTDFAGDIYLYVEFDGVIPDGLAQRLSANPYDLFAPRSIWIPVSISSGTTYTINPSGGIAFGGTGTQVDTKIIAPSGGVLVGGTGTMTFGSAGTTYTITPSGGVTLGGSGNLLKGMVIFPSGGVTMGGTGLGLRTKIVAPSGGVTLGGTGNMTSNTSPVAANAGERTKVGAGT